MSETGSSIKEIVRGRRIAIVSSGPTTPAASGVANELLARGIYAGVIDFPEADVGPGDLKPVTDRYSAFVILEDGRGAGGIGDAITNVCAEARDLNRIRTVTVRESWRGDGLAAMADDIGRWIMSVLENESAQGLEDSSTGVIPCDEELMDRSLNEASFAWLFGVDLSEVDAACSEFIARSDLRYRLLNAVEKDRVVFESLERLEEGVFSASGRHKKEIWEKGWNENLSAFTESDGDTAALLPRFLRQNVVMRLKGEYAISCNPHFETAIVTVMRMILFRKYFSRSRAIFEFGCGTGLNLVAAAAMFPDKTLWGLDWSASSCEIIERLRTTNGLNIHGRLFDMFEPDGTLEIGRDDAALTIGALEQLGEDFTAFLDFLIRKRPQVCMHFETMNELYTRRAAADFITLKYTAQRRYLTGFLTALRRFEKEGRIRILQVERTFGSQYHEGYSFVAWQPV